MHLAGPSSSAARGGAQAAQAQSASGTSNAGSPNASKQPEGMSTLCVELRPELQASVATWLAAEHLSNVQLVKEGGLENDLLQHLEESCQLKVAEHRVLTKRLANLILVAPLPAESPQLCQSKGLSAIFHELRPVLRDTALSWLSDEHISSFPFLREAEMEAAFLDNLMQVHRLTTSERRLVAKRLSVCCGSGFHEPAHRSVADTGGDEASDPDYDEVTRWTQMLYMIIIRNFNQRVRMVHEIQLGSVRQSMGRWWKQTPSLMGR